MNYTLQPLAACYTFHLLVLVLSPSYSRLICIHFAGVPAHSSVSEALHGHRGPGLLLPRVPGAHRGEVPRARALLYDCGARGLWRRENDLEIFPGEMRVRNKLEPAMMPIHECNPSKVIALVPMYVVLESSTALFTLPGSLPGLPQVRGGGVPVQAHRVQVSRGLPLG